MDAYEHEHEQYDHEIPHHFICPISLQIMKDPVTVATGITYDRDSIQRWHLHNQNNTCPVTNQPLPITNDFTPNHTLRRLIHSWRASAQLPANHPSSEVKVIVTNLLNNLNIPEMKALSLKRLQSLASESGNNIRVFMKEVGVVKAMVNVVMSCYLTRTIVGLQEALNVLHIVRFSHDDTRSIVAKYDGIIHSLTWALELDNSNTMPIKLHAIVLLKDIIHNAKSLILERLNRDFFKSIVSVLRHRKINNFEHEIKEVLHVMLTTCTWPRNCSMMVDSGAVFELVELELETPEKGVTELIMAVLFHLCSSADGRAKLLGHAAGLAVITKRIAKVSQKVDERALMIVSLISKYSGTDWVIKEMMKVGTVEKLCMVLQVNGLHSYAREKAREILKRHSNVWKDSPCLDVTLLTRYPR